MAGKYANYILFNRAWKNTIFKLNMEQRGELLTALYEIAFGNTYETSDMILDILVGTFGDEVKQSSENYEERCETNRKNRTKKEKNDRFFVNEKTNVLKERKNEEKKDGRIERRTEGLLSNPSGLERTSDSPAPMGAVRQTETKETKANDTENEEPGCNKQYKRHFPAEWGIED